MERKIGLAGAISTLIGTMVGAAIFVMLGSLASQTGNSLVFAFLVGAIPAFLASAYYIQLSSIVPENGGSFVYTKRFVHPIAGMIVGLFLVFAGVGAIGMLALGFVDYFKFFFTTDLSLVLAVAFVVLFILLNILGIEFASKLQIVMVGWMLLALIVFIIAGFWAYTSGVSVATEETPFFFNGTSGFLMASVLAFYSYAGYGLITELGGKIKNAKRNAPLAIGISLVIVTTIYALLAFVALKVVDLSEFIAFTASLPMAAEKFLPQWLVNFIAIGGIMAIATTINAIFLVIPEELRVMAEHRDISPIFKKVHAKFNTPYVSILTIGIIAIVLILLGVSSTILTTMTVVGLLIGSIFMGTSMLFVLKKHKHIYENAQIKIPKPVLIVCCVLGILTSAFFMLIAFLDAPFVAVVAVALVIITFIYMKIKKPSSVSEEEMG
ncbi:APC family permease [Lysinibacillus sp. LZ02]|uniref:APC family permease n=1 Tax=Lysinibacillus sp. LZ02 TaxID=3420668 RepID=UPI003D35B036